MCEGRRCHVGSQPVVAQHESSARDTVVARCGLAGSSVLRFGDDLRRQTYIEPRSWVPSPAILPSSRLVAIDADFSLRCGVYGGEILSASVRLAAQEPSVAVGGSGSQPDGNAVRPELWPHSRAISVIRSINGRLASVYRSRSRRCSCARRCLRAAYSCATCAWARR